jgi:hypothetical protein
MIPSKPIKTEKIKQIQGVEFSGKWWCFAVAESGNVYMSSFDLKAEKWSDWTKIVAPKEIKLNKWPKI